MDPQLMKCLTEVENRARKVRDTLQQLIFMLDMQEKVPWPEMLDKFGTLASEMTALQDQIKRSNVHQNAQGSGSLLRTHALVPTLLSQDIDPLLQQLTEGRLPFFNHEVVPNYLSTKCAEVEQEEREIAAEQKTSDAHMKKVSQFSKKLEVHRDRIKQDWKPREADNVRSVTHSKEDTRVLVNAVMYGEGLRPTKQQQQQHPLLQQQHQQHQMMHQQQMGQQPPGMAMGGPPPGPGMPPNVRFQQQSIPPQRR